MRHSRFLIPALIVAFAVPAAAPAQELSSKKVLASIDRARDYLLRQQRPDGSWPYRGGSHEAGATSLALLALINAGVPPDEAGVAKGLGYLRDLRPDEPNNTYDLSLAIMALAAADAAGDDPGRDRGRLLGWTRRLVSYMSTRGELRGGFSYGASNAMNGGDRSNSQYAVLALRDAAFAGIPVDRQTWETIAHHWVTTQARDGGWTYSGSAGMGGGARGSMTVAGIATLSILKTMLARDRVGPDGTPDCCAADPVIEQLDDGLERAAAWMTRNFSVRQNPGNGGWLLYYLYGLERAGRLSGVRFYGDHDWYREGADFLIRMQSGRTGEWRGIGGGEDEPVIGTSFALLFLSKGLAPVLINKLKYGPPDPTRPGEVAGRDWNLHPGDVRNLTAHVSGLPKWPKLVTWQLLELPKLANRGGVEAMLQAPVLYIGGSQPPAMTAEETTLLREYIDQGGFIFAVGQCSGGGFDRGLRDLVRRMFPDEPAKLAPLPADHPVYRVEYLLDPAGVRFEGVELGCRTPIIYVPEDVACLWDLWKPVDPPDRSPQLVGQVTRSMQVGVNVLAYATGREPPNKLEQEELTVQEGSRDLVERGLLQIAKLRHTGEWDAAPQALRNLLIALNQVGRLPASTQVRDLVPSDPNVFRYPLLYMHGRGGFRLGGAERDRLRTYLENGGVLFADACCGSKAFDAAFRDAIAAILPDRPLTRIPPDHELFSESVAYDLSSVRRRGPAAAGDDGPLQTRELVGEPVLEGVEIDGRLAVVYSKYDISCALERQSTVACSGYVPEDALKIAINVLRYAVVLQDPAAVADGAD